jgi:glycosyltransferase involved in cell wall biosynthesis
MEYENDYGNIHVKRVLMTDLSIRKMHGVRFIGTVFNWKLNSQKLVEAAGSGKYDVVYGHNPMEFSLAAKKYSLVHRLPMIYEVHGLLKDTLWASKRPIKANVDSFFNKRIMNMERKILDCADKVVVQTLSMKERVINEYMTSKDKIEVVYNGVDLKRFSAGDCLENKQSTNSDRIVLSYFGFLDNNNGIRFLVESLDNLDREIQQKIRVLIVGRGRYADYVREFSEKNDFVDYLGLVDHSEIVRYYSMTDVFVIPRPSNKATENLVPIKLLEAMAMNKLVLVSDVHGMTEVVTDSFDGVVFRNGDKRQFRDKLTHIVGHLDEYSSISKNARRTVTDKYSWERGRAKLADIYNALSF